MELHKREGPRGPIEADVEILERLYEVGHHCARIGSDSTRNLNEILDAAIFITGADKGKIQLYQSQTGGLTLATQRGFERSFLEFFSDVHDGSASACGSALSRRQQIVVEDVTLSELFSGKSLDLVLAADVRAVQFTPLVSSTRNVLGMISTHFRQPTRLAHRELRFLDLLARLAADYLERKQNEDALRAKQDQLERITSSAPILIIQCSRDLRYIFVNSAYAELIGKPVDQIVGKPIVEIVGETVFAVIEPYINRVLAGERARYEKEFPYPTRGTRYLDCEYVPDIDSSGTIVGWIGTLSDITERRRAEQRLRDKEQYLAMLAHELRAPLAPISAGIEILQRANDAETLESTLPLLAQQTRYMVRLLDDLLDVSRVSLGKIELKSERIPLRTVIEQAVQSSRSLIEDKSHDLVVSIPEEPLYVTGDSARLVQVLCNLLDNACKYMDRGGSIALTAERINGQALIRVRDNGIGIPDDDIARIFELFAQLDTSRDRPFGGLGIGLTLAKSIIELHGGTLEVHSEGRDRGSEFVIHLPLLAHVSEPHEASRPELDTDVHRRVLIVEDSQPTAKALARLLRLGGHRTYTACDGPQGIEVAKECHPDIVLLDIGLPKLDGYDTCKSIRNEPWGKDMVLVALSGYGQATDVQEARQAGFDHYLIKPVSYRTLNKVFAGLPCEDDKLAAPQ